MSGTATMPEPILKTESADLPSLLVFSDDWGRHPSSCQHIVGNLLGRYRVVWVNTIGMRTPSFNLATFKRGLEKLTQWIRRPKQEAAELPEGLTVLNPQMWPWFTRPRDRKLNRYLLRRALKKVTQSTDQPVTAITTLPIVADLIGELNVERWVYYCVDDFSVWPGLDQKTLKDMESELIQRVDSIIAVSDTLQDRIGRDRRTSELLTHGVDLEFWTRSTPSKLPIEVEQLPGPVVTFWGVIDKRMDTGFVKQLAAELSAGTILLVGPQQDPDPELLALERVRVLPPVAFETLPSLAAASDVLIMPYIDADVTRAMQPLKLKEYLATGKPVVVRDLPATQPWGDCLDLAETPEEFSALVRERLNNSLPAAQTQSRGRLANESWSAKARQFEEFACIPNRGEPQD